MSKAEYLKQLFDAYNKGDITEEAYDAGVTNADMFCEEDD